MERKLIPVEEFDRLFDEGSDEIDQYVDWSKARRMNKPECDAAAPAAPAAPAAFEPLALPADLVRRVDLAAAQANMTREALAARLIAEGLDRDEGLDRAA